MWRAQVPVQVLGPERAQALVQEPGLAQELGPERALVPGLAQEWGQALVPELGQALGPVRALALELEQGLAHHWL